jgi:hypothetical protein
VAPLAAERYRPSSDPADHPIQSGMETFSTKLANIVLPEASGGDVRLGSLWETNPAVIVFLRHYG